MSAPSSGRPRRWPGTLAAGALLALAWPAAAHQAVDPALLREIQPGQAHTAETRAQLIERGRKLFMEETFGGNGRTCASCHPPSNNFTIDPAFIATLPPRDPLFVAEFNPQLAALEVPALMRQFGLILENLDGFANPGVLRGVPHTLGLTVSVTPHPPTNGNLAGATGWSGDGAPGDGSLRNFAVGAVVQHFPRTLARRAGKDFRLPTEDELDAMEAFQLSLGRQEELDLPGGLVFRDGRAEDGKRHFFGQPAEFLLATRDGGTRTCSGCHGKAGANNAAGLNQQRQTNASHHPNAPACRAPGIAPGDGGFGAGAGRFTGGALVDDVHTVSRAEMCGSGSGEIVFRGTEFFNTASLVEAADTGPFFHNNIADTIEDAVAFYASDTFNASLSGVGRAFVLDGDKTVKIAAFLRAINALDNIRQAIGYIDTAMTQPLGVAKQSARLAIGDTNDAIKDLRNGPEALFTGAEDPVDKLDSAKAKLTQLLSGNDVTLLAQAKLDLESARARMLQ